VVIVDTTGVTATSLELGRVGASAFDGALDDVRIYDRVLSAGEVQRLYNLGKPTEINHTLSIPNLEAGLVGHWTFDGMDVDWASSTAEIRDRSGQGNHGNATTTMNTQSVTPGLVGQGMSFDGVDDHVRVTDSSDFSFTTGSSDQPFSIASWVRRTNTGRFVIASKYGGGAGSSEYWLTFDNDPARVYLWLYDADFDRFSRYTDATLSSNEWYHIVATYDGTETSSGIRIFVDGVRSDTSQIAFGTYNNMIDTSSDVVLGADTVTNSEGSLDDVRIYNRELSAQEVQQLYNLGR
jgi:hypothetical protein